jgi:hypothetical protein
MKNNRPTLKQLQQQLEELKKSSSISPTSTHKASVAHDIKNSYIQNLHMKSSMFTLWLFSWVIFFMNKLPFIKPIITLASLYYGRTTWWKILVKIRKVFIMFNAAIGVYVVWVGRVIKKPQTIKILKRTIHQHQQR